MVLFLIFSARTLTLRETHSLKRRGFPAATGTSLAGPLGAQFEKTRSSFLVTIRGSAAISADPDKKGYPRPRSVPAILAAWACQFMIRIRRRTQPTRPSCWMQLATLSH